MMMAEEDAERKRLAAEREERMKKMAEEEAKRAKLGAEERMREENARSTAVIENLNVQPTRKGMFGDVAPASAGPDVKAVFEAALSFAASIKFDPMEVPIWTFGSAVDAARAEAAAFAAARAEGGAGGLGGGLGGFDIEDDLAARDELPDDVRRAAEPVSYTHLTLPTKA